MKPKDKPIQAKAELTIPASPAWFGAIRKLIICFSSESGFSSRESGSIALAVDEALSNVHRHGYDRSNTELIELSFETTCATKLTPCNIIICIEDRGKQVDIELIRSRDLNKVRPGGLGVHLIQSIMDKATWTHRKNGGMRLVLEKHGSSLLEGTDEPQENEN